MSMGSGKTIVEFFSVDMVFNVYKTIKSINQQYFSKKIKWMLTNYIYTE